MPLISLEFSGELADRSARLRDPPAPTASALRLQLVPSHWTFFFFFWYDCRDQSQLLVVAKQTLYWLSYSPGWVFSPSSLSHVLSVLRDAFCLRGLAGWWRAGDTRHGQGMASGISFMTASFQWSEQAQFESLVSNSALETWIKQCC